MLTVPRLAVDLRIFPADDATFRAFVEAGLAAMRRPRPGALQDHARTRYPAAIVRVQEELARSTGEAEVWYVFRHGGILPPPHPWWRVPGHPWAVLDDQRRFTEASPSFAAVLEVARERVRGRALESFANPEDPTIVEDLAALWAELRSRGELHSTLRFNRLDGGARELEFHATLNGRGRGRHLIVIRERR